MNLTPPGSDIFFFFSLSLSIRTPQPLKCLISPKKSCKGISAKVTVSAHNEAQVPNMEGRNHQTCPHMTADHPFGKCSRMSCIRSLHDKSRKG